MRRKLLFIFFVVALVGKTTAQVPGRIAGEVRSTAKKPVPNASVSLFRAKDSSLVKMAITDSVGKFEFNNLKADTLMLFVTSVGYKRYYGTSFILNGGSANPAIPTIELKTADATVLSEVTVRSTKPFVENKIDRMVVNVDALISNAGTSAMDVLQKSPGVNVDLNGNITLKGKQGVVVFINDKPSYLSASDLAGYLKSLSSSSIESIEIMTNPPARYDAAGNAGIINIRLKKSKVKGLNGNINTSYGQGFYARTNNAVNLNYRVNKVNFFSNLGYNINNDYQDLRINRYFLNDNKAVNSVFSQRSYIKNERKGANARIGLDYYLNNRSTFGMVLSGFRNPSVVTTNNKGLMLNGSDQLDSTVTALNTTASKWKNASGNLNFAHKFDSTGKEISVNLDYIYYRSHTDQAFNNTVTMLDGQTKSKNEILAFLPSQITIKTAKADYSHPLKNKNKLDAGAKTSFINTDNTAEFYDQLNGTQVINNDYTNYFKYKENINAVYVNYNQELGLFAYQTGLRLENTAIKGHQLGNSVKPDSAFNRSYTSFFPTVYLSYKLDSAGKNRFGFSYGRRIDRPNYQDMNPFLLPIDKFTFFAGNPFLVPSFSHNIELSHSYDNKITTTLQYSNTRNIINETIEKTNTVFTSRPGNIGKRISLGVSVNATLKPAKWLSTQIYSEFMNAHYNGIVNNQLLDSKLTYWTLYAMNQAEFGKTWSAEITGYYQTRMPYAQFILEPMWYVNAGLQKKILKEKGSVKAGINNIFYSVKPHGDILGLNNTSATFFNYLDNRVFTITFSYRFNSGSSLNARQSGGSETEQGRVKTN